MTRRKRTVKETSEAGDTLSVRICEACGSDDVVCDYYEDVRVAPGELASKWLCQICAQTIFGIILLQSRGFRNHGGYHIDPVLVKGIVQSLNVVIKIMRESA